MTEERNTAAPETEESRNFILNLIDQDIAEGGQFQGQTVHTRFPPEPNGYLHIGHCKALCIDFGTAEKFGGLCNLRMDDTNPAKEDTEYVDAIQQDIHWLGFDWGDRFFYGSDYFEKDYEYAVELIKKGLAYVCELTPEEFKANLGDIGIPTTSPYRDRPIEENLRLFEKMKNGEVEEGKMTLRAKIDLASGNLNLRDPIIYRIRFINHHRQGTKWCIYPMYDFTHCISDSIEGITHSICTLEFDNNRELYDWMLDALDIYHPRQIEFARLNLTHTLLSKRKLIQLVREGHVRGWDDPRMPTISGLRRRGCTPEAIRDFCSRIGVARTADSTVDYNLLEFCVREHLNAVTPRCMAVLDPIRVVIEDYPEDKVEVFDLPLHPEDASHGSRPVPFCRELWIERDDFRENPPKKYYRLAPGAEVRLRYAYYITCREVIKDEAGNVVELRCSHDPASRGGSSPDGRRVKGTIHWVSARHARPAEVRLYDHLFLQDVPGVTGNPDDEGRPFTDFINPDSLKIVTAMAEPYLADLPAGGRVQFERLGYFCSDPDGTPEKPVFNRTVTLKDSWAKLERKL